MKETIRQQCNNLLDNVINLKLSLYPELRYIQNLWSLDIINNDDYFYEEPYDTVIRILPNIIDLINNKFPEKAKITDKIKRANIISRLENLGIAKKTDNFKLVPVRN